ncbi:MAG: Crp/Fnr family transcriptional regulator [Bacteriovoracaceae bacterium]
MKKLNKNLACENCDSKEKGIFCSLETVALDDVSKHKVTNTYKKGHTLFFQGNPPFGLYCINSGKIKVSKIGSDGKESIVRIAGAGDVLGHRSLFSDENYTATATAIEEATICFIDKQYINDVLKAQPTVAMQLIQRLSREMGAAEAHSAAMFQKNVRERLAELFLTLNKSYGVRENGRLKLDIILTREEIASMVGTASETVIRFITEFKDEGLIEQEGKTIYILNEEKMVDFANLNY